MEKINPTDPRWNAAVDAFAEQYGGMDVRQALLPTHWTVALVDGRAEVVLNAAGVRALALLAPRPDAQQVAEDLISHMNDHGIQSHRFDQQ